MIQYIKGDLLKTNCNIILHGCNAQGVMGSGVAKVIREKYPAVYLDYKQVCESAKNKSNLLGRIVWTLTYDHKMVGSCITQEFYGKDGIQYVDYEAIRTAMIKVATVFKNRSTNIAMPKIGAGLGGGDWNIIERIIKEELATQNVYIYEL